MSETKSQRVCETCGDSSGRDEYILRILGALIDIGAGHESTQCLHSSIGEIPSCTGDLCIACEASKRVNHHRDVYGALYQEMKHLKSRINEIVDFYPEPK